MSDKYLIVGLGNVGKKYRFTRHNVGFLAVDRFAAAHGIESRRIEHKAFVGKAVIAGKPVILAKPQTMMNLSGDSVGPLVKFYKIAPANVLVIYDELDLPEATLRLRSQGGAGGHNGMRSVIQRIGNDFPRIRIGIGRPPGRMPAAAYVLQSFADSEWDFMSAALDDVVKATDLYLSDGIGIAMNRYNVKT